MTREYAEKARDHISEAIRHMELATGQMAYVNDDLTDRMCDATDVLRKLRMKIWPFVMELGKVNT